MKHTIESVMTTEVVAVRPSVPFRELVRLLERHRISALPVTDDGGRLVGIVSEADLLVKEGYPHGADDAGALDAVRYRRRFAKAAGTCAAEVMTRQVMSVPLGTPVVNAARLMLHLDVKRLPVVDEAGRLAGIVTRADLLKLFLRPDPAIRWEIEQDLVRGKLGLVPGEVRVDVRDGAVALHGQVQRRSQVLALVRQAQAVEGVVTVDAELSWRVDDQLRTAAWPVM
jgi:CBS-domain-containing membrane protein